MLPRVKLIPLNLNDPEHLGCLFHVRTHPDVSQFMPGIPPSNFLQHVQYLYSVNNKQFYLIEVDRALCGYCQHTLEGPEIELGWALHPKYWSQGIGKESVLQLVQLTQGSGKALILYVRENNLRALSLYQKTGFVVEGIEKDGQYKMHFAVEHDHAAVLSS